MDTIPRSWSPETWRARHCRQIPDYPCQITCNEVESRIQGFPPLVSISEIQRLRRLLVDVSKGRALVLQGGDCAESFDNFLSNSIHRHYRLLQNMASQISDATGLPVLRIGRIAGQYAKPRSEPTERVGDIELPSYRGDIINGWTFSPHDRCYAPERMEMAYYRSAGALNLLRSLNQEAMTTGAAGSDNYFTSHEALLLPYEQAQLQQDSEGRWHACSGHFLWIGERTRQIDGAHVEFLRGVANPIGVKIGPSISGDDLLALVDRLDPDNTPGRLTLICRLGVSAIERLPNLLETLNAAGRNVIWLCDPMHGNGVRTENGIKTRHFDAIVEEAIRYLAAHGDAGTHPGGVHLELTADDVTECVGGPQNITEAKLSRNYRTLCDPRLNAEQALAFTSLFAKAIRIRPDARAGRDSAKSSFICGRAPQQENLAVRLVVQNRHRNKACFIGPEGSLSYAQLDRFTRQTASALTKLGVKSGDRIAIALDDSAELMAVFFGSLAIGALPVVLNPNLRTEPLVALLRDFSPSLVIGKRSRSDSLDAACDALGKMTRLVFGDCGEDSAERDWRPTDSDPAWDAFVYRRPNEPALIQYTSGSTGRPKGVVHCAASVLAACEFFAERQLGLTEDDILYSAPKSFFGYGMGNSIFFPLWLGATAIIDSRWPTEEAVIENLTRYRATAFFGVPTVFRRLLDCDINSESFASLRLAFSAGAPLSERVKGLWRARVGIPLHDGIGSTELCHVFATTYPDATSSGTVGRMVSGWQCVIVGEDGECVTPGKVGALVVRTPTRALGYWSLKEEAVAEFSDCRLGSGWHRTGDLFSQDDSGQLYFHGREDDHFKVRGRWVMPIDVENALTSHDPDIGDVFVVPGSDPSGEQYPVLFISNGNGPFRQRVARAEAFLTRNLDSYQLPALCLPLSDIPLTPSGKPDRRALASLANDALAHRTKPFAEQDV
jgi:3-deoxy-D-arabino-heptulosonate 7-phosphate (DAHP) synthase class II/acyl-coenzyme A synthetase/AMP-(fatty) acid ligase